MTFSEENYLKGIYHLTVVSNLKYQRHCRNDGHKASSVTDMLKKLAEKDLVNYIKYRGVS
jgi:DtxR family Mn-dependent transcriptional regulator